MPYFFSSRTFFSCDLECSLYICFCIYFRGAFILLYEIQFPISNIEYFYVLKQLNNYLLSYMFIITKKGLY